MFRVANQVAQLCKSSHQHIADYLTRVEPAVRSTSDRYPTGDAVDVEDDDDQNFLYSNYKLGSLDSEKSSHKSR
ncbi:hypothetical protein E4U21_005659 [Claviceps maximensis]|nr:hypothetical protein E4U21_005659 [Claviceps maximensis]